MENENSVIQTSQVSEEIINEKDLPYLLEKHENEGLKSIEATDYQAALVEFKRIEEIMESISAQGGSVKSEYIISTLHNISYCHQQ
jgi:hypothetical protein